MRCAFLEPDAEFSPIPFWFWNDELCKDELKRQIHDFYEKGVHGFVIHPRIGLPDNLIYMSSEWLDFVAFAVKKAAELNMQVVLYDEGMYPSGSAHGMVVGANAEYASRGLRRIFDGAPLVAGDIVVFEQDGVRYVDGFTGGTIRGVHFGEDDGEAGAPPSADLLNADAMRLFIELTHEKYYSVLSAYFGNTIIGMFTDEPCIKGRRVASDILPWGAGFLDYYLSCGGHLMDIPKFWEDGIERKKYEKAIYNRLCETYYDPISRWCEDKKIALMGHPEHSDDIGLQRYFHVPGQDVVWRFVAPENDTALKGAHSTQAKCTSDSARHSGKRRNSNECFGACNRDNIPWNFTYEDMKWYIDWLCVRGVNMLIPHAFYYSVVGARRFERPPDVGPNNVWWSNYKVTSNYIKRLCWLMTDSYNAAKVAVLCGENGLDWQETAALYRNQVEFNYLEDMYICGDNIRNGKIHVRDNVYDMLLVPKGLAVDKKKLELLTQSGAPIVSTSDEVLVSVERVIQCSSFEPELRFSHVVKGSKDFYFFVNEGDEAIETTVTFFKRGKCELWNAFNGTIENAEVVKFHEDSMAVKLRLGYRESIIVHIEHMKEL